MDGFAFADKALKFGNKTIFDFASDGAAGVLSEKTYNVYDFLRRCA